MSAPVMTLAEVREKLSDLTKSLENLNTEVPVTVAPKGVVGKDGDAAQADFDATEARMKQMELRRKFSAMPKAEVMNYLDVQAGAEVGKQADAMLLNHLAASNPAIRKLLDTSGGAALIRQDLEPMLYALFVKRFPMWERIRKEPSNGLVHAYNQITAYGAALWQTETGTVTDDANTYNRVTSAIGVLATRRGVTLKEQFAVAQGGAPYNSLATELSGGVTAITKALQVAIFHGNATTSGQDDTTEYGLYNVNAFTGLRYLQGTYGSGSPVMVNKGTSSYVASFNTAVATVMDNGGSPSMIAMTPGAYADWVNELLATIRQNPGAAGAQGLDFGTILTAAGPLPILTVPGGNIGQYTFNAAPTTEDIYILDEDVVSVPWLGSDSITTLEIPIGAAGALTRLYIMFMMAGFADKAPLFNAKVRRVA